jgi:hypothetical protein
VVGDPSPANPPVLDPRSHDPIAAPGVPGSQEVKAGPISATGKTIVIGETMDAVKKAVQELREQGIDAKWYQAWGKNFPKGRLMTPAEMEAALERNARWIESKIKEGVQIYDIGIDPKKATRSPFYQREKEVLQKHNYPVKPMARG